MFTFTMACVAGLKIGCPCHAQAEKKYISVILRYLNLCRHIYNILADFWMFFVLDRCRCLKSTVESVMLISPFWLGV